MNIEIDTTEKVCHNCKHLTWMIGIGQGLRCGNPKKEIQFEEIPSSKHTCNLFEVNEKLLDKKVVDEKR